MQVNLKLILIFIVIAFFSFYKLGSSLMNVDAQHWFARSVAFTKAIKKLDFAVTYQDPKPGVTVMWLSGLSLDTFLNLYSIKYGFKPQLYTYDTFALVNFAAIFPLVCLNLGFLVALYFLVKGLFNENTAVLSVILLGLHPFYLAISRFLHVDSTLSIFMTLSFLTLLYYYKTKKQLFLVLSGVGAGLALLTKTQAVFLFLMFGVTTLVMWLQGYKFKKLVINGAIWLISCFITFFVLFPAMWVNFVETLKNIYSEAFYVANTGRANSREISFYLVSMPRIVSIPFLLGFFGGVLLYLKVLFKKETKIETTTTINTILGLLLIYTLLYFGQMGVVTQKINRYLVPMFPTLIIFVAYTLAQIKEKLIVPICFVCMVSLCAYFAPYYETFGIVNAETNTYGSLYNEVGTYLNKKPNAQNFKVVAMTKAYSLRPFVKGTVYGHEESMPTNTKIDYLVTNDYWLNLYGSPAYFATCIKEETIYYHNVLYWDIYKCN